MSARLIWIGVLTTIDLDWKIAVHLASGSSHAS
jgi:hypothetical protein